MLYSGYCPTEKRYLTAKEKYDIVVTEIITEKTQTMHEYTTVNEDGKKVTSKKIVSKYPYSGLEEFYALNPNCCFVVKEFYNEARKFSIPCGKKINGRLNVLIYISYIFAFDEQDNNRPIRRGAYYGMSNCGQLESEIGTILMIDPDW